MKDFTGKTIFLGIDVHKETYSIAAICEEVVVKKATIKARPEELIAFCKKFFVGARITSAYEAGFSGFYLHRALIKTGIENIVIHAADLEVAVGDRVKTDKKDSLKLATQLAAKRLKGIYVPSEEREEQRTLTRVRDQIVEHKTATANQIKSLLHLHGLILPDFKKVVSPKWIASLKKLPMKEGIRFTLNQLIKLWESLAEQLKEINAELEIQAAKDSKIDEVYKSVPGIGPLGARILSNELGNMSQYNNERQLFSYTGLTPSEYSSGSHVRKGNISRQGNAIVRKMLVLAAWKAIRQDNSLREIFERIGRKAGFKKAIIAVARRLIGRIRACFKKNCSYEFEKLEPLANAA